MTKNVVLATKVGRDFPGHSAMISSLTAYNADHILEISYKGSPLGYYTFSVQLEQRLQFHLHKISRLHFLSFECHHKSLIYQ